MKCLRLTWKGGEVKDHDVGRRGAWDECSWTVRRSWWKITAAAAEWYEQRWRAEQSKLEREEPSVEPNKRTRRMEGYQLPRCPCSPDFWQKKQSAVLISASTQVLIAVFFISASNMFLYRRLHGVPDAASTPGLMSFDPLRRCPASCLGAVAMLYPDKEEKCIWRNEGITIVKQELENQLERWDGGNASGEETK